MLRAVGQARGVTEFAARESRGSGVPPALVIRWADGRTDRLAPVADTYFACPTHRNLGDQEVFKVGNDVAALLVFPFQVRPGLRVVQAELLATSPKQYGRRLDIGVFAPAPPAGPDAPKGPAGLSAGFDHDRDIGRHPAVLYAETFERSASLAKVSTDPAARGALARVARDPEAGFEPLDGHALRVRIPKGGRLGLNHHIRFADLGVPEPEEAYFRYHLRLGADWDPVVDGGKLPGFAGTYGVAGWGMRPSDGSNGWSARGAFMRVEGGEDDQATAARYVGTYAYTASSEGRSGEIWGWNRGYTGRLLKGRWYAVEQYVRMNTPGADDGVLRVWIDGVLAFERTDLRWRTAPELRIESVWLNVYHGGTARTDRDLTLYVDNIVIAREHIGPGRFGGR